LTVDEVAEILLEKRIPCVPVLDESNKLMGILTRSDILKVMISLTGMEKRGVDFGFEVADQPGSIKAITDVIRTYNGRIASILISYERAPVGFRNVFIRIFQIDMKRLGELKKELTQKTKLLYILDFLGKNREIF
ncbi:CBS domain-containing protein, partial [bacterium]|nr:CBS domain-containing protein [bacterium]